MPNIKRVEGQPSLERWPHEVPSLQMRDVLVAIDNPEWQRFRKSLKGWPTRVKLGLLQQYLDDAPEIESMYDEIEVAERKIRVANYINALRRGGQLNENNEVVR